MAAVRAFEQPCEEVDVSALHSPFDSLIKHLLHAVKVIFVYDGIMRSFHDDPFIRRAVACRFGFVIDLLTFTLHHDAGVHQVRQRTAYSLIAPQCGIADSASLEVESLAALVGGGVKDSVFVKIPYNAADSGAVQIHLKYLPHVVGGILVDQQLVAVGGVFFCIRTWQTRR